MSARAGEPLSVVCRSLLAADGLHTTRAAEVRPGVSRLGELAEAIRFADGCHLGKPGAPLADRGCDSVWHYRLWHKERRLFLVRAKSHRVVRPGGRDKPVAEVVTGLKRRGALRYSRAVDYKGGRAPQYVVGTEAVIGRPARPQTHQA